MLERVTIHKNFDFLIFFFQLQVKTREKLIFTKETQGNLSQSDPKRNEEGQNSFLFGSKANLSGWTLGREEGGAPLAPSYHLDCFFRPRCHCYCPNKWLPGSRPEEAVGDHRLLLRQFPLGLRAEEKGEMEENVKTTFSWNIFSKIICPPLPVLFLGGPSPEETSRGRLKNHNPLPKFHFLYRLLLLALTWPLENVLILWYVKIQSYWGKSKYQFEEVHFYPS